MFNAINFEGIPRILIVNSIEINLGTFLLVEGDSLGMFHYYPLSAGAMAWLVHINSITIIYFSNGMHSPMWQDRAGASTVLPSPI